MVNVAIVGFGRIGRSLYRRIHQNNFFVPRAICDIASADQLAALLEVDSIYGRWDAVSSDGTNIVVGDDVIPYYNTRESLPDWGAMDIDLVVDCTGRATTRAGAQPHLQAGARRVLVSGPSKSMSDCDAVLLPGINMDSYDPDRHKIISLASCTTNALAPVVKVLQDLVGIKAGFFTTVHAYTNTQTLTDQPMKDRRDSWAAAENIIPSSSGAAKALKFIWPDLNITGKAYRVPVRTGSIVEVTIVTERPAEAGAVNDAFRAAAAEGPLYGVLGVLEGEYASSRIINDPHSSMVDLPLTQVLDENLLTVAAWYDNEAGFSMRLAEAAVAIA